MNVADPLSSALIMGIIPDEERGVASGMNSALWRMPNALSSYLGSALIRAGELKTPFFVAGTLYIVSITLFWRWFRIQKS